MGRGRDARVTKELRDPVHTLIGEGRRGMYWLRWSERSDP
jgi:hypothetical protein